MSEMKSFFFKTTDDDEDFDDLKPQVVQVFAPNEKCASWVMGEFFQRQYEMTKPVRYPDAIWMLH
jgi:hypothetical protein